VADPRDGPGRRALDHRYYQAWWVLVVGALFQGGNYLIVREMMARDDRQRAAERALAAQQHDDLMRHYAAQTGAIVELRRALVEKGAR
jgi:hypothetical protein